MPVTFTIPEQLVRATIVGENRLTEPEFREFLSAVLDHPEFRPGTDVIYDRRSVVVPPDDDFVRAALGAIRERADRFRGGRWAVVIPSGAVLEVVRMTSLLGEQSGIEARPFVEMKDALAWLGRPGRDEV